ncbi:hypothetical protein BK133_14220 [Paenibacillus sp. FSL H8-0548]|uniref:hypothetical protein n=1 Tax=Paenibacillus sp. FSL H8-0548 TaxID=1920422 RepID=UPI00096E4DEE|nr:hypothetical protein [Paenibacillus sp. FSL H8-0548]OMF32653.1 hypothetical protein BK133_14220 [Paenibacillus sp. FSL H8-0548]
MRIIKRLLTVIIVIALLLGGASWWLISYIKPEEQLDMSYTPIDVKEKALDMVKKLKPELVLTEADINHLIKMNMKKEYASSENGVSFLELTKDLRLDGAHFDLEEDRLIARMNVTYMDRIPAELDAVYSLEWQAPNIVLRPQSLSLKNISLPTGVLETIIIPLDLPSQDIVTVQAVRFEQDLLKIDFKLQLKIQL